MQHGIKSILAQLAIIGLICAAIFCFAMSFSGCSRKEAQDAQQSLADARDYRDRLCDGYQPSTVERCDRVTFDALASAFCPGRQDHVKRFELSEGFWHRDTKPCFTGGQDVGSKSECSLDGYLGVLTYAITIGDQEIPRRMLAHLEANDWYCGEGDKGATWIKPLQPLIERAAGASDLRSITDPFAGFRGHLLGLWLWNDARLNGGLVSGGQTAINRLVDKNPSSPFYAALARRWHDGDYDHALSLLFDIDECKSIWGSCSIEAYIAMSVAVMEGK